MNDVELPPELPGAFDRDLRAYDFETRSLWDEPFAIPPDTRRRVIDYVARQVEAIRRLIFPVHGL